MWLHFYFTGPHGAMVTFNLTWIAQKYELEELLYDDNLSLPNSSYHADLSMRLVFSGVGLRNNRSTTVRQCFLQENRKTSIILKFLIVGLERAKLFLVLFQKRAYENDKLTDVHAHSHDSLI